MLHGDENNIKRKNFNTVTLCELMVHKILTALLFHAYAHHSAILIDLDLDKVRHTKCKANTSKSSL